MSTNTGYSVEQLLTRLEQAMNEVESLGVENKHLCDQKRDLIVQNENLHRDRLALDLKVRKQDMELGRLRTLLAEAKSMVLSISRTSDDPTQVSWADELLNKIKEIEHE